MEKSLLTHNCAKADTSSKTISKQTFSQERSRQLGHSMETSEQTKHPFVVKKRLLVFSGVLHHTCRALV